MNKYEPVIGLEIHVQLKTKSKMFCSCDNTGENQPPNTTICPICTGHPGVLPVANEQAIRWAVMAALALDCKINKKSYFDRKSYFYPDLPKGYQISQYTVPFGYDGHLVTGAGKQKRRVRLARVHLEEDTGKLLHDPDKSASYIDYNRAGTPLLEIVTEPDLQTPREARIFLQELRQIMRYLGISDAEMEKGHLRCDANVSLRPNPEYFIEKSAGEAKLYPKTEIKNLNSFRSVEGALEYEIIRQTALWEKNQPPASQSTRGWDEKNGVTLELRTKEEQHDYRYFPEPDVPAVEFDDDFILKTKLSIAELPLKKKERFQEQLGLGEYDAGLLVAEKKLADFFEQVISELKAWLISLEEAEGTEEEIWKKNKSRLVKVVANWTINQFLSLLNEKNISVDKAKITPENFAELMTFIYQRKVNNHTAATILRKMFLSGRDPSEIMDEEDLGQLSDDSSLEHVIDKVIKKNQSIVEQYKAGKTTVLQFLIGQVMKETKGRADALTVGELLTHKLK